MKKVFILTISVLISVLHAETRIMPLGDSLTYDDAYNPKPDRLKASYRSFLWYKLQNAGYSVDFVGSLKTGWDLRPPFDGDNEGHPGWDTYDIAGHVYNFLKANPADIVLLMAGANDWDTKVDGINSTLNEIDRYERNYHHPVKVILARIPNRQHHSEEWMSTFNKNLQTLVNRRIANGDDIYVVDMEYGAGIDYSHDFQDRTHLNDNGYEKLANVWYDALKKFVHPSNDIIDLYISGVLPSIAKKYIRVQDDMIDLYMNVILPSIAKESNKTQ